MKFFIALSVIFGGLFLAGCESDVGERRTVIRRSYRDVDDDRVYYRNPYYYDTPVVRRVAYDSYSPRYRTYSSNPLDAPASGGDGGAVRRVTVIRR